MYRFWKSCSETVGPCRMYAHADPAVNVRAYDYWPLVSESGIISQHISSIVIFIALFIYMYSNQLRPEAVVVIGGGITIFGYGFWDLSLQKRDPNFTFERELEMRYLKDLISRQKDLQRCHPLLLDFAGLVANSKDLNESYYE